MKIQNAINKVKKAGFKIRNNESNKRFWNFTVKNWNYKIIEQSGDAIIFCASDIRYNTFISFSNCAQMLKGLS